MLRKLWGARSLVLSLSRRQFHLRYRQSAVGLAWAVLPPLATLGVATLVFDKVVRVDTGDVPYAIFALSGLAPWTFFANSVSLGIPSVVSAQAMVTRLSFPRASLPVSMVGVSLIDLAVASLIFVIFAYGTGAGLPLTSLWFPLLIILEIVLVVGVVLLGSALNVFARDIRLAVPLLVQLWLFVTPVMYPLDSVPDRLRAFYLANPMTGVVESFRTILVRHQPPQLDLLVPAIVGSVIVFVVGVWYFSATERRFADAI